MNQDKLFLEQAIELAMKNKSTGGRPFGALIVKDQQVVSTGVNQLLATFDPSSHAEMEAIRSLTKRTSSLDLNGCIVYASGQPCPMCLAAIAITNISEIVYAFDNHDADPFNYSSKTIYDKLGITEITFVKMRKVQTKYTAAQIYG